MSDPFIPYEVRLNIRSDDASYVLYEALEHYCRTINGEHRTAGNMLDSDEESLLAAAAYLAQQVRTAWGLSGNLKLSPLDVH